MVNNVARIAPEVRNIHVPAPLRDKPLWCVWAYEHHPNKPKALKVPQYTAGGRRYGKQGSPEDLAKLTTFALARDAAARRGLDGVGFALTRDCGIVALDFDGCVVDGVLNPVVADLVKGTYAEYSPSGNGVRAFFRGDLGNRKVFDGTDGFSFEVFSSNGFVTVTGNMLPFVDILGHEDTIAKVTPAVEAYCVKRFGTSEATAPETTNPLENFSPKLGLTLDQSYDLLQQLDPDIGRADWIRVALALSHEYDHSEDAFQLWNDWSSYGASYPGEEALRYQWDSLENRTGFRPVTMATVKMLAKQSAPVDSEKLAAVAEEARQVENFDGKFRVLRQSEIPTLTTAQWLIKGVLPRSRDPIILFGASGAGKSFVALDQALAIARGVEWRGCRVTQGRVLYIAAEGGAGIAKRVQAYCDHHGIRREGVPLDVILAAPNLLEQEDVTEVVKSIASFGPYDLVIVDTLAQVTPGANENAGEDMGPVLSNIKAIQNATGATVEVVHHAGKDLSRGSRGWSGLKAAAEAQIEVVRDDDTGQRYTRIEKMKDGEDGARYGFKLEIVQIGVDEDGDAVTSCVVVPVDFVPQTKDTTKGLKRRGRIENHVLDVVTMYPPEVQTVKLEDLVTKATDLLPPPEEGKRDVRRQHVARAIQNLCKEKDGQISMVGNSVLLYA